MSNPPILVQTTSVTKANSNDIAYYYYTLPDTSAYSVYNTHAKPLLLEIPLCLTNMKDQCDRFYQQHVQTQIDIENSRIENEKILSEAVDAQTLLTNAEVILKNEQTRLFEEYRVQVDKDQLELNEKIRNMDNDLGEATKNITKTSAMFQVTLSKTQAELDEALIAEADGRERIKNL